LYARGDVIRTGPTEKGFSLYRNEARLCADLENGDVVLPGGWEASGHQWSIATHKQDLTPEQIAANAKVFMANMPKC
jgi:hypothetical protein